MKLPIISLLFLISVSGCSGKHEVSLHNLNLVEFSDMELNELTRYSYFFGHRSVGNNIIEGINDIYAENNQKLAVIQTRDKENIGRHIFAHTLIGQNGDPKSKIKDFDTILNSGVSDSLDFAFLKFCYVDIKPGTDIEDLFNYYRETITSIQRKYPQLKILHFTVPMTVKPSGIKGLARIILGKDDNKNRNKFNKLIRQNYKESEIVDIARIESTYPDQSVYSYWTNTPGLIPAYSSDGRHLNETGRMLVARELILKILAKIDSD
jgi:hypothetical protein